MSTQPDLNTMPVRTSSPQRLRRPTAVATEVLLLRPRGVTDPRATVGESTIWPMFVMVVTEPADPAASLALPLFDLLNRRERGNEPSIVAVEAVWSVLDSANALLTLTVRATEPVSVDLTILLPAAPVLDVLHMVARGATIGITTQQRADRLRGDVDVRTVLRDVVMLSCLPSAELSDLVAVLHDSRDG